jgi:hypothetical protein
MRLPDGEESLKLNQNGTICNSREISNFLLFFGRTIDLKMARKISVIMLVLSLLVAIIPARSLYLEFRRSKSSQLRLQHHAILIDVEKGSSKTKDSHIIVVASFDDLVKMADRYGNMILHESRGKTHHYSIQDEGTLYRYSMVEPKPPEE